MLQSAHQGLRDRHKTLHVQLVLAQVEHLERPVPFQHLRDICDPVLFPNSRVNIGQSY